MATNARPAKRTAKPVDTPAPRRYRSPLRDQRARETRAALIAAAGRLFTTNGWVATGMRDVATEAGVATETVYAYFSSKRNLLEAVIELAAAGDDRPLPVAARPEFLALGRGPRSDRIAAAAQLITEINRRVSGPAKVIREAASSDDQLAEVLRVGRERQRQDVEAGAALIIGRKPTPLERDGLWALLSPEMYLLLVEASGWTPEQYEAWMAETLERVIPSS